MAFCWGLPRWAGTRRNIHPVTYPGHQPSFISFFHLLQSITSMAYPSITKLCLCNWVFPLICNAFCSLRAGNCGDVCHCGNVPGSCRGLSKGMCELQCQLSLFVRLLSFWYLLILTLLQTSYAGFSPSVSNLLRSRYVTFISLQFLPLFPVWWLNNSNNNNNCFTALCPWLPGWAGTRRNTHPPTILIIIQSLSASSICHDP